MEKGQGKGTDTLQTDNVFTRKEYIEREALCYQLAKQATVDGQPRAIRRAAKIVADFPAADVVPVRHGRWLEHRTWAKCSECKYLIGFETTYCPNCGARMDGDGE